MTTAFSIGLDVGLVVDPSALAVLWYDAGVYHVRHLDVWWPEGPRQTVTIQRVGALLERAPALEGASLALDASNKHGSSLGRTLQAAPFARHLLIYPTRLVQNDRAPGGRNGVVYLPKKVLVRTISDLILGDRLRVVRGLAYADQLRHELTHYREKARADGSRFWEAERASDHDDLLIAVGLAAWIAEHRRLRGANAFQAANQGAGVNETGLDVNESEES